ncbi:hypothetical protein GOD36_26530 [Sinorhizobium medicae]|nr:hypothetical protein [Sinorhizobium medicae]MDX0574582.1 hypothetical protein [Sinorhizobium medicae]MDX0673366.1 hypothetical protein [Sinorhizobium medicae]MDX0710573.1 hypothetical protein [Sinorhizobium medicae]MDX0765750.1 hypothetical protein [Sinorhizobium medicae]MDX0826895.1 hypothetical protein [Sinorhizobium medicae]
MSLSPQEVMALSVFEYLAALDALCNDPEGNKKLTESEKDDLWDWLEGSG